ncbi:MAG: YcaO-like family protein [Patescibacteria group bacterium]
MKNSVKPLVILFGYRSSKDKLTFLGRAGFIEIIGNTGSIQKILRHCNGFNTVSEIKVLTKLESPLFEQLLDICERNGLVADSRSLFRIFHVDSANPPAFFTDISPKMVAQLERLGTEDILGALPFITLPEASGALAELLTKRHSVRKFLDRKIALNKLGGLLESICGLKRFKSIPSAGALYPLTIYLLVTSNKQVIPRGIYRYSPRTHSLTIVKEGISSERTYRIFNSVERIDSSAFIVFVTADLEGPAKKYSNRAYRFVLLEAGHVAQNAYLYCAEKGLGVLEYGGFNDELAAEELDLNYPKQAVLVALIIGVPAPDQSKVTDEYRTLAWNLGKKLVGQGKPIGMVNLFELGQGDYRMPRVLASATVNSQRTFASAATSFEATVKVIAEGYERFISSQPKIDRVARALDFDEEWLDPRIITPLTNWQYEFLRHLQPFSENKKWQWVLGRRLLSGQTIYVSVDNVFYPLSRKLLGRKCCVETNSSGVAAHSDYCQAVKNALLELIERDAVMVSWYTKRRAVKLPSDMASETIRQRISFWQEQAQRKVRLLNLTLDSVPVVLTIISSEKYPCFVSGAAAAFSYMEAIEKAFNETEFMLLSWLKAKRVRIRNYQTVMSPSDHGTLYFGTKYLRQVDWLLGAEEEAPAKSARVDIFKKFNPVVVKLNHRGDRSGLKVVRVLSEKLLPINFGYGTEYHTHQRFATLGLKCSRKFPGFPHFFA